MPEVTENPTFTTMPARQKTHATTPWRRVCLFWTAFSLLLLPTPWLTAQKPAKRRGKFLRMQTLQTTHKPGFKCSLAPSPDSNTNLLFSKYDLVTHYEVKLYETLLEYKAEDESDRSKIEYRLVPGELIRGEKNVRTESIRKGVCANETFLLNNMPIKTDCNGIFEDKSQYILQTFDDLSRFETTLAITHPDYGHVILEVTRQLIPRNVTHNLKPDILTALGIDFRQCRLAGRDGIKMQVTCPSKAQVGGTFQITLQATNQGAKSLSSILARTVARQNWLGGRNFYIGSLSPGETRIFTRTFRVPEDKSPGNIFLALGLWDIFGAMPEKAIPLKIAVKTQEKR